MTFWESITIFLASLISIAYEMLRKAQDTINRKTMLVKLLGAVTTLVAAAAVGSVGQVINVKFDRAMPVYP